MLYHVSDDIKILRKLAYEYYQVCLSKENLNTYDLHRKVNDLCMERPVVLINEIPFHELNIEGCLNLHCIDNDFKEAEDFFRKKLFQWKYFRADMILQTFYPVVKIIHKSSIGLDIDENINAIDNKNHIVSHEYHDVLSSDEELSKIKIPTIIYDEEATIRKYNKISNVIGDIIPVKITGHNTYMTMWDNISRYRGVTPLLIDLLERPGFTHRIVKKFTEIEISISKQMEELDLYEANPIEIHCTSAINSTLPGKSNGEKVTRSQIWGRGMAQILGSVSREMHEEFDINYMKELMKPFGLVYYGCCEPLDKKIDIVEKIPNLRKISITPWADIDIAAEVIGNKYVIANKPNPASVAINLDEDNLRKEIKKTLDACKRNNCSCDIVLKDISSVNYKLDNLVKWEKIVMEMVNNY